MVTSKTAGVGRDAHGFDTKFSPIIPGFHPDPSICLIDGLFFLVTSSFHLYPGLPIYVSSDLKSWRLHGKDAVIFVLATPYSQN